MKKWFKSLAGGILAVVLLGGMTGCEETTVRSSSYGSSYYQPYDYYYYPQSRIYLNIATGYYFYPYKNRWRKVRSLPRSYHLNHHDRVTIRIKSKDRPYARHHVHRTKYAPRRYYRDRNRDKHRTKVRVKRSYDYYYYPNSRVYYNAKTGYYYYPSRKSWKRSKRVPSKYRLKHRDRVKVKVASRYKPYKNHKAHRARYAPRYNYHKNRVKKQINRYERTKVKDYEKGGM